MSFHPQTPQSPSQLSPGISDPASSMNTSLTSITTALPTPAHSVNGSASQPSDMSHDVVMGDDPSQKRKRSIDDSGERDEKKAHFEGNRLGIEDLHLDVGEKYLLCQTPHRSQRYPHVTEDLFELFGLTDIAAEVAREKPNGEKNALRKTYKGHIKRLGVMGRFEPIEKDWEEPKETASDDQEQDDAAAQAKKLEPPYFGFGKITTQHDADFWRGRNHLMSGWTREAKAAEHRAVAMAKGVIPVKVWDSSILGDITPAGADAKQGTGSKTAPGTPLGVHGVAGSKPKPIVGGVPAPGGVRPQRINKKRGYGDSSFDGYGDGFPDDGYSTGDGEGGSQKRRKKVRLVSPDDSSY
ncbi:Rox3 mediator complex subunit [Plectosphaerella plurivora]|uniref:Mediator of RNA polymerase II transcription subunit 19 n=1 Tax=Plectosphaerella plurivora TaxID=936078 RepID=A0A9P9AB96_9PEZI|nr:Rox3 mediator complex subunit [Plectosphaerella plurivora]